MTERCQTNFTEKIDNKNYIIYVSIVVVSFAILYFYRFHFATICFGYVLGCLVCYYGINTGILYIYSKQFKCHLLKNKLEDIKNNDTHKGCFACGSKECQRHDSTASTEPWVGLQIHKQLDQAIEDFYNTILDQFINSWYSKITLQPFFVDELRYQLRYASACLLRRAVKINYSRFITERLIPCALRHYTVCADLSPGAPPLDSKLAVHPAAANRNAELKYLRCITNAIMPYLLKTSEVNNSVFRVLIREIFAGWVLLSLTDVLADPYILNTLIVLATGDETMAQLPTTPNYKVEFLETFSRQTDSVYVQRCKLLRIDLDLVIQDQGYFYAFVQYMKTTSHMHLLQFYKDIKCFQTEILNPDLSEADLELLHKEACDMYARYIHEKNDVKVPMQSELAIEFAQILDKGPNSVKRLQNCRPLFEAARQSQAILEKIMLPKFMHSEDFYQLTLGPRMPTGFHKNMVKRLQEKSSIKLTNKAKSVLKTQTLDGHVLQNSAESEADCADNMDILKYLDSVVAEDLSTYKVVLTNVETRPQALPRRGTVRLFTVAVHSAGGAGGARLWALERSENDFHLLRHKLHEYHGERLLHDLPLPSRRDNSPLETIRYKYEDFLQRLLQKSLLQSSELLHLFLTVDGDFSMVVQASTLNANSTDLANIYQSVTHRLKKEKGQHLENFLGNLLVSSDMERFQALKQGRDVEEAQEVIEDTEQEPQRRTANARNIHYTIFGNNFNTSPVISETRDRGYQTDVVGFTQCFMYLLIKVIRVPGVVAAVIGSLLSIVRDVVDELFNWYLNDTLRSVLSERRLAHLIRLGHGELFGKRVSPRVEAATQSERARSQLQARVAATGAHLASGPLLATAALSVHALIQHPHLNKQLVYNLLDLCVMELFPELENVNMTTDPNS